MFSGVLRKMQTELTDEVQYYLKPPQTVFTLQPMPQ